jgi:proteasome lid subunit RPN8/RPN11
MSVGTRTLNGRRIKPTLELSEPPPSRHEYVEVEAASGERAFIARRVLRDANTLTRLNLPNETGGVLMGRTFTDGLHAFTVVTDLIPPLPGEVIGTVATVEITAEGRRRMETEGRLRDSLARAIGWMHSHPVQPAFFSGTDVREQSKWASEASVGLVVSGRSDADPKWRVFLGAAAIEALAAPFTVGACHRPPGPDPAPAAAGHPVPEPLTQRRTGTEEVAPDAEYPELDWPWLNGSSAAGPHRPGTVPARAGRTLTRIPDGRAAARASSTPTARARTGGRSRRTASPAGLRLDARATLATLIVLIALGVALVGPRGRCRAVQLR